MLVKLNSIKILLLAQPTPEAPSENVSFTELEELTTLKVVDLRKMVIKAVMSDGKAHRIML